MLLFERLFFLCVLLSAVATSCLSCVPVHSVKRTIVLSEQTDAVKLWPSVTKLSTIPSNPQKDPGYTVATGWAIDKDHVMTAGHFCESAWEAKTLKKATGGIRLDSVDQTGRTVERTMGKIIAWVSDDYNDMCLIESKDHGLVPLEIEPDLSAVETEDRIISVGGPRGQFAIRREGFVWAVTDEVLLIGVEIQPGNSGGPIVWQGKVIGMVIMSIGDLNEAGIAVKSTELLKFIEKHIK